MRRPLLISAVACAAALLLAGCATQRATTEKPVPLRDVRLEDITGLISSGKPLEAIQDIQALERSGNSDIPTPRLNSLFEQAKSKVSEQFDQAVAGGNFSQAYSLFQSAGRYGSGQFPQWSKPKLLLALAESYRSRGMDIPALLTFRRAMVAGADVAPAIGQFGELALQETDRPVLEAIVGWLSKNHKTVPESYTKLLSERIRPSMLLPGIVTIWVNRGIKIQNGVGIPDRVIGSGFFIDKQGYLITNYHVIESEVDPKYEGFSRLYVMLYNQPNTRLPAKVVGYDKVFDLALLKVEITPQVVVSLSNTNDFQVGDPIYAIGSPGGLENTITSGIISATGRRFLQLGDALQVDVPLNPGNSGGPLLDSQSKLVGIVFSGIPEFQGINFAIPAHWLEKVLPQLYDGGEVVHPWIGAALQKTSEGLTICYVMPGSPAAKAGLEVGDVVVSLDGREYSKIVDLQNAILSERPGSLVELTWKRQGKSYSGLISLGDRPFVPLRTALERDIRRHLFPPLFGMQVEETGSFLWKKSYRITKVYPGSIADETGLSVGDPITVNGWQVDKENDVALLQFSVQRQKEGFLQSEVQIGASLKIDSFI